MDRQQPIIANKKRVRLWFASGLFAVALVLFIPSVFPINVVEQRTKIPLKTAPSSPLESSMQSMFEKRLLILDWPMKMREKDSAIIELAIAMNDRDMLTATARVPGLPGIELPVDVPDIYSSHNIVAISRLDMAGVEAFREEMREPLLPGRETTFRWSIRANEAGIYRGVVWLHLDLVPKAGGPAVRVLLMAKQIEIEVVTVFGLSGNLARGLGIVGLVLSTALGYPFVQDWVKKIRQNRGNKRAAPQTIVDPTKEDPDDTSKTK